MGQFPHNGLMAVKRFNGDEVQGERWGSAVKMDDRGCAFPGIRV